MGTRRPYADFEEVEGTDRHRKKGAARAVTECNVKKTRRHAICQWKNQSTSTALWGPQMSAQRPQTGSGCDTCPTQRSSRLSVLVFSKATSRISGGQQTVASQAHWLIIRGLSAQ